MMTALSIHRAGDRGLLLDVPPDQVIALVDGLQAGSLDRYLESVVPTAASILVTAYRADELPRIRDSIADLAATIQCGHAPQPHHPSKTVEIPVIYDGPDLEEVAQRCGITREQVAEAHSGTEHRVGFFGFAPGFAYINGLAPSLQLPRRDTPRTSIDAGYVAIAADQTVVYPGGTPGGWHLIGRTTMRLWDLGQNPPARLGIGDRVIFKPVGAPQ